MNQQTNNIRAITWELMAMHAHNTAMMMVEVFSGLRTAKPMPQEKKSDFLTMGEFVTELADPNVAKISSHFVVTPDFSTDDIVTLLSLYRWCNENGVTQKVFDGVLQVGAKDPYNFLISQQGREFVEKLYEICDEKSMQRIEKRTSKHPIHFLASSLSRCGVTGTWDEYDGSSPHIAAFAFYTGDKNTPFALTHWGTNYLNTYISILGG